MFLCMRLTSYLFYLLLNIIYTHDTNPVITTSTPNLTSIYSHIQYIQININIKIKLTLKMTLKGDVYNMLYNMLSDDNVAL